MSWCDKLSSTPGMGFRLEPHFGSADSLMDALAPILGRYYVDDKAQFTITTHDSANFQFSAEDGFQYGAEPLRSFVMFAHKLRIRATSGGPPVAEMLSKAAPFSSLLVEVGKRLIELTLLLPNSKARKIVRVGVVTTTTVSPEDAPPGIMRMLNYLGRPWGAGIDHYDMRITAEVGQSASGVDRCVHQLTRPEGKDELLTLKFDWQRYLKTPRRIETEQLSEVAEEAQRDAKKYFEDLAEGGRFDEVILSESGAA